MDVLEHYASGTYDELHGAGHRGGSRRADIESCMTLTDLDDLIQFTTGFLA